MAQELQATREVMRLREELRQRERDIEFEHRLDRFAVSGAPTQAPTAAVPPLHMSLHRDDAAIEVGTRLLSPLGVTRGYHLVRACLLCVVRVRVGAAVCYFVSV